nr:MAG TPA: tail component [Caudoviricetes sp.]
MNILQELNTLLDAIPIRVETGVFSDIAPDEYAVITPLTDDFPLFGDNQPEYETQEVRLSLYSKGNYLSMKNKVVNALLNKGFTITGRQYIAHEDDTGYHHYAVDTAKLYRLED